MLFSYQGRISKRKYQTIIWTSAYVIGLPLIATMILVVRDHQWLPVSAGFMMVLFLIMFFVNLSASIRRLHDLNRSGSGVVKWYIPLFGWFYKREDAISLYYTEGTSEENNYGPAPIDSRALTLWRRIMIVFLLILLVIFGAVFFLFMKGNNAI